MGELKRFQGSTFDAISWRKLVEDRDTILEIQELTGTIDSQRREFDHTLAGDEPLRRDQLLHQEQQPEKHRDLREAHIKSLHEMEELMRVQESRVDESSRRRLIENQNTINELTARIQE